MTEELYGEALFTTYDFDTVYSGINNPPPIVGFADTPHEVTGRLHWFHWHNTDDFTKRFTSFDLMFGCEGGVIADLSINLMDYSKPHPYICRFGWDHYTEAPAPCLKTYEFAQGGYSIPPNGTIDMAVLYNPTTLQSPTLKICVEVTGRYTKP